MSHPYLDTYYPPMPALEIRLGYPEEAVTKEIVLGRNVLNCLRLLLDGPADQVEVLGLY